MKVSYGCIKCPGRGSRARCRLRIVVRAGWSRQCLPLVLGERAPLLGKRTFALDARVVSLDSVFVALKPAFAQLPADFLLEERVYGLREIHTELPRQFEHA